MADVGDDDFGELYADVEAQVLTAVNDGRSFTQPYIHNQQATKSTAIDDFPPNDHAPTVVASQLLVENEGSHRLKEGAEEVSALRDNADTIKGVVEDESDGMEEKESDSEDDFNILLNENDGAPLDSHCDGYFQMRGYDEESDGKANDIVGNEGEHFAGNCVRDNSGGLGSNQAEILIHWMADFLSDECSRMEDEQQMQVVEDDPFLKFIDYARSILCAEEEGEHREGNTPRKEAGVDDRDGPGWSWIASHILKTCISYSSGVTAAILLSEISQAWSEQRRTYTPGKRSDCIEHLKKKHRRSKLPNSLPIDSIYEKNFLPLHGVLEVVVIDAFVLPGTDIYMLRLGDFWSSNTIDLYLHRRYYELVSIEYGILRKGREVILTGCHLRGASEGLGHPRLLPSEYMVILLDEDQDDDAMLLGAQFCSDSFSSISLDAAKQGMNYSLCARIDSIGSVETVTPFGGTQRLQVTLVDNDGTQLKFVLWGDQIILANLLSVKSMLALDRPFVASSVHSGVDTCEEVCLEYGSATQLYMVPFIQKEEQVCLSLTPNRARGSNHSNALDPTQVPRVSQMMLPCDSYGSVDFSNFPLQSFIGDLHDKMCGISLFGVVTDLFRETSFCKTIFYLKIEDSTGTIWAKLHFIDSWSLGRLGLGHTIYISGLTCCMTKKKCPEALWFESDGKASFVNLSCLPAMLNSSCLHRLSCLADISTKKTGTHVCRVWLDQIENWHVSTTLCHASCGRLVKTLSGSLECDFCCCRCTEAETRRAFHLKLTVADESAKSLAWCAGQTAMELLQISPDEFDGLPEEEQVMYPISLENERYVVAMVKCHREGTVYRDRVTTEDVVAPWEITRALKL